MPEHKPTSIFPPPDCPRHAHQEIADLLAAGLLRLRACPLGYTAQNGERARAAAAAAGLDRFEERHWRELERQLGLERPPDDPPPSNDIALNEATHSGGLAVSAPRNSGRRVIRSRWLT